MITSTGRAARSPTEYRAKEEAPTRERLLAAGLRLFAERGFDAVSVGEIEAAVGLVPRRGALYRHFPSKSALLEVAVERHLEQVNSAGTRFADAGDHGVASAAELALWILGELDRQREITDILQHDGERLTSLRDSFRHDVSDRSYLGMAGVLRGWLDSQDVSTEIDLDGAAMLLLGALVNFRRSEWTLGRPPLQRQDEDVANCWARLCAAVVDDLKRSSQPDHE